MSESTDDISARDEIKAAIDFYEKRGPRSPRQAERTPRRAEAQEEVVRVAGAGSVGGIGMSEQSMVEQVTHG